jgi:hypothetical protein
MYMPALNQISGRTWYMERLFHCELSLQCSNERRVQTSISTNSIFEPHENLAAVDLEVVRIDHLVYKQGFLYLQSLYCGEGACVIEVG